MVLSLDDDDDNEPSDDSLRHRHINGGDSGSGDFGVVRSSSPVRGGIGFGLTSNNSNNNNSNNSNTIDDEEDASDGSSGGAGEVELQPLQKKKKPSNGVGVAVHNNPSMKTMTSDDEFEDEPPPSTTEHVYRFDGTTTGGTVSSWRQQLDDFLYPPNVPRSCQLLRPENIAVPACYLLVGLLQGLSSPLTNVLPLDLGASEAQQTTISSIRSLPASFKLIFGFVSDNFPVCGYRRKPYMMAGWTIASFSMFALILLTNLDVTVHGASCFKTGNDDDNDGADADADDAADDAAQDNNNNNSESDNAYTPPDDAPSIPFFAVCLLIFGFGFWMADVMGDSIVAEKAKLEPPESRGSIQSSCYSYRFFGLMAAAPLSTYIYTAFGPYYVILLLAMLPLCILPAVYVLGELPNLPIKSTSEQCLEIWNTVQSRAAWQPMGFVFLYNLLQVGNSAWREFQRTVLGFTSCQLNLILIVAYVLLYLGILAYKYWFIKYSWRHVYVWTTLLNGIFSALQVLLIYGMTFGLSPFWFALGDDVFAEFIGGVQFLPTTIMMVHLCPAGSEGASYAMFTTVHNAALTVNSAISTSLLGIWNVSKETMADGNLSGMVKLTYLTTFIQLSGVLFVGWLPHTKEALAELASMGKSAVGGYVFLAVTFLSVAYAMVVGFLNVVAPGWMGES